MVYKNALFGRTGALELRMRLKPGFRRQNSMTRRHLLTKVGKVKSGRVFFAVCGQTNGLSQFKVDSICLSMFPHCGSSSVGPCRLLPYAKLSGTNPEIGTTRGNFSINKLL